MTRMLFDLLWVVVVVLSAAVAVALLVKWFAALWDWFLTGDEDNHE